MENKKLIDFQEQWEKLVHKANWNYLNENNGYYALSMAERVWFNIQLLIAATDNGGMISFFYTHEAEHYLETIDDLAELKQKKIIKLLKKIGKIVYKNNVPRDIEKRNEILNSFPDDGKLDKKLENIDNEFYKVENKLEEYLVKFIIENNLV